MDQHIHRRLKNEEGKFFARILAQAGRGLGGRSQGVYLFTTQGELLEFSNTSSAARVKRLLASALRKFDPTAEVQGNEKVSRRERYQNEPPAGGLVVNVTTKVLGGHEQAEDARARMYRSSLGRDHLWIRTDEAEALARRVLPESLKTRIARFHLVDNTRGEPPMWRPNEIQKLELVLDDGRLRGSVRLETNSGDRGYEAQLLGAIEAKDGKVVRFDLVARGRFWGHGRYTRFRAPEGKFPLAVAFTLLERPSAADKVIPGGARGNLARYLR